MRDDLLDVVARWLDVQARELKTQHDADLAARHRRVGAARHGRKGGIATHMADVDALDDASKPSSSTSRMSAPGVP